MSRDKHDDAASLETVIHLGYKKCNTTDALRVKMFLFFPRGLLLPSVEWVSN